MPFIRGRYYANPIAGNALETARAAEQEAEANRPTMGDDDSEYENSAPQSAYPIRRIDIEIAELVPAHSGRATKSFVVWLYRAESTLRETANRLTTQPPEKRVFHDPNQLLEFLTSELSANGSGR